MQNMSTPSEVAYPLLHATTRRSYKLIKYPHDFLQISSDTELRKGIIIPLHTHHLFTNAHWSIVYMYIFLVSVQDQVLKQRY